MATQYPLNHEAFVWALSAFCQLNRIPFDAQLLIKQYPPPYTNTQLEQALQSFGFNTSLKQLQLSQLNTASLPCLAVLKVNSQQVSTPALPQTLVIKDLETRLTGNTMCWCMAGHA